MGPAATDIDMVAAVQASNVTNLIRYSLIALVVYDYLLTIPAEITKVWQEKKRSVPTWLFMANRYLLLVSVIVLIVPSTPNCTSIILTLTANDLQLIILAVFSALRVYALSNRRYSSFFLSIVVFALGLIPVAIDIYTDAVSSILYMSEAAAPGKAVCAQDVRMSRDLYFYLQSTSSASKIAMEVIVITVTFYKLWRNAQESSRLLGSKTLSMVMLKGGAVHFTIMLVLSVAALLVTKLSRGLISVYPFSVDLPSILISRFLLQLRETSDLPNISEQSQMTDARFHLPTLHTKLSMGNMGQELDYMDVYDLPVHMLPDEGRICNPGQEHSDGLWEMREEYRV